MAHIVFLTLFLGLVSGRQPIELEADPIVVTMRLELDGKPVAALGKPPWRTTIDFGRDLEPLELVAVGLDATGQEVGRASQAINFPRPTAEAEIVLQYDTQGTPVSAEVRWRHLLGERPGRIKLTLDDKPLRLIGAKAVLPKIDLATPHVLTTDLQFGTGSARKELVFGGTLPDSTGSELTATAVMETGRVPASLDGCFAFHGRPIRAQAIEKGEALVIIVRDPDAAEARKTFRRAHRMDPLDADTEIRLLWPVANVVAAPNQPASVLFPYTGDFNNRQRSMLALLLSSHETTGDHPKRRFADAVAVAGVQAMTGARRRAVILVLGSAPDDSHFDASTARHYLASIGVPLFVWSLTGPRPELMASWGEVLDVSDAGSLDKATELVKRSVVAQRIAWLDADPIHALRATVKASCGLAMVARGSD